MRALGNWHELSTEDLIRADDALRRIAAYSFRNERYGILSQGEKQRVMIVRALVTRALISELYDSPCHLTKTNGRYWLQHG